MKDFTKNIMGQIEKHAREEIKQRFEKAIKPFKQRIAEEGATVKLIPKPSLKHPFDISIKGTSEELLAELKKALEIK